MVYLSFVSYIGTWRSAMMDTRFIFCFVCTTVLLNLATPLTCPSGTFLYTIVHTGEQFCIECQAGTFLPYNGHTQTFCRPCEEIKEPKLEILISPCNKTHDAVIHCVDGYYREEARNPRETGQCRKCTECPKFTGRPCETYTDTICCWDENYDVVPNHHGVLMCRERPWFCRRGQYFETRGFYCLPCPEKTFMPLDYHTQPECWKCREYHMYDSYRPLHSVIVQPCNRTHAPVIRCEDGFFMDHKMSYRDDATGCSPCTDCSTKTDVQYEGRKCDGMEDTVCCPQPNMTVVDTPDGPVCMASSASCDMGYCLLYHTKNSPLTCAPCSNNVGLGQVDLDSNPRDSTNCSASVNISLATGSPIVYKTEVGGKMVTADWIGFILGLFIVGAIINILILRWKYLKTSFLGTWIFGKLRLLRDRSTGLHRDENETMVPLNRIDVDVKHPEGRSERRQRIISLSDYSELEQSFGNKIDLKANKNTCFRREDHEHLICGEKFGMDTLPSDCRDQRYLAYIKAACQLTVRVRVYHISESRPENDPYYELRGLAGTGLRRFGNGLVYQVSKRFDESNKDYCPCKDCQIFPENAKPKWAEFLVVTSAQIVFDETECSNTSCKLWCDRDVDPSKIPSLKGWKVKMIDREKDVCIMQCVSHDKEDTDDLEEKILNFKKLCNQNQQASDAVDGAKRHAVIISHPHGLNKRISQTKAKAEEGQVWEWTYDDFPCRGSLGAPVCLLSRERGCKILTTIYNGNRESRGFDLDFEMQSFNNNYVTFSEKRKSASFEVEPRSSTFL